MSIHKEMEHITEQAGELAEMVQKIHEPIFRSDYDEEDFAEEETTANYRSDALAEQNIEDIAAEHYRAEQRIAIDKLYGGDVY